MTLRMMVVDDHLVVREGLKTVFELEDDIEVVAEAGSGEEALARLELLEVDLVLLDLLMPGMGGIEACREIRSRHSEVQVLMLTSSSDDEAVLSSLVAGASGYCLKNTNRCELARSVRLVAQGQKTLDPAVTEKVMVKLVESLTGAKNQPKQGPLSSREVEVVKLVAQGHTNRQIAEELIIAEKTARNHVSRILEKLGVTRRGQAAAWAIEKGLLGRST